MSKLRLQNTTTSRASKDKVNMHLSLQKFTKGSPTELPDALLKFPMPPSSGSEHPVTMILEPALARFMDRRGFTLECISSMEVNHALANTITTCFSTSALSKKNLRKASSLRSPRKSWKTSRLMRELMHSMVPDSFQNLRLCLPEG